MHAKENDKSITYVEMTAEQLLADSEEKFDVVTCLEVLEHVPDPDKSIQFWKMGEVIPRAHSSSKSSKNTAQASRYP